MDSKKILVILIGLVAGIVSFRAYEVSGTSVAAVSLLITGWVLVNLMTAENIINGIATVLDPFHTAINFLLLGFLYASVEGNDFWLSVGTGILASVLGTIVSMWVYKYWTIGE